VWFYLFNIMELIIYIFLFLILFLGVIFNLKITNLKKVKEIRNKAKDYLKKNKLKPRDGVINVIKYCKKNKIKICFVTSTTKNNIDAVFISLNKYLKKSDFDYIGHNKIIKNFNNKTDIYLHCLKKLKLSNKDCLAIEDTEISFKYQKFVS